MTEVIWAVVLGGALGAVWLLFVKRGAEGRRAKVRDWLRR